MRQLPAGTSCWRYSSSSRLDTSRIDIARRIFFAISATTDIGDGTNLDGPLFRRGQPTGNRNRFIQIVNIDDVIATELFGRLGEWAVGDQAFSIANAQTDCRRH